MKPAAVFLVAATVLVAAPATAEVTGDLAVLPLVAERHAANKDALRTWRGKADVRFEYFAPGQKSYERAITHDVEFVLDRVSRSWRWRIRSNGGVTMGIEDPVKRPRPSLEQRGLVHGDTFAEVLAVPLGQKPFRVAIRHRGDGADRGAPSPMRFDPMHWLENAENDLAARARFFHDQAKDVQSRFVVRRDEDLVTVEGEEGPPGGATNRYVIDLSKGASLLSFRSGHPGVDEALWEYDYEKVNGL